MNIAEVAIELPPYAVEFDTINGIKYMYCQALCFLPIILPCLPCIPHCQRKEFESQKCKITDQRIEYEAGWLTPVSTSLPIERVENVTIQQGCIQRQFGVKSRNVHTTDPTEGPVVQFYLVAPKNAEMVRDVILQRREKGVSATAASTQR